MNWSWFQRSKHRPGPETKANEEKKKHITFWRRGFGIAVWKLVIRKQSTDTERENIAQFKAWLQANYPGIEIPINNQDFGYSTLRSGIYLQIFITVILGSLTHFHIGVPSRGTWLLVWMYGGPALRWMWFINHRIDNLVSASLSVPGFFLRILSTAFAFAVVFGVCASITVLSVELLESLCGMSISLKPGVWILIGFIICVALLLVGVALSLVAFLPQIWGIIPLLMIKDLLLNYVGGNVLVELFPMVRSPEFEV
jgi:hypothetical protein